MEIKRDTLYWTLASMFFMGNVTAFLSFQMRSPFPFVLGLVLSLIVGYFIHNRRIVPS